jgi:hypothetical protein
LDSARIAVIGSSPHQALEELLETKKQWKRRNSKVTVISPISPVNRKRTGRQKDRSGGIADFS